MVLLALVYSRIYKNKRLYVLWVDLEKCFMTFPREAGLAAVERCGAPPAVTSALRSLYAQAQGRYDSAHGMSSAFDILRGFLQGAVESPDFVLSTS